ncbi:MAG: UDP-N-acetylmuramoyl-L-alanine--D-glutamate ligase, partial [Acidobacteriota bacterium]
KTQNAGPDPTFIVELSSFQLETIDQFRCDIALLLNITADHLDRYPSFEEYARAKEKILANQTARDYAVLNADNPGTAGLAGRHKAPVLLFSRKQTLKEGVFVEDGQVVVSWQGHWHPVLPVSDVRLRGLHNLENVLAATAAGFLAGLQPAQMAETLKTFAGVEHRLEFVRRIRDIAFYNDSKATNVDSAAQALQAFEQPLIVIMGGQDKGGDFRALEPLMSSRGVRLLIVIGAAAEKILAALGSIVPTLRAGDMQEAVESAFRNAQPGDIVLLAPACASFDMFDNYEHRGRVFKEIVGGLK